MNNAERFARLFRGYTKRYGRYDLADEAEAGKKRAGRARTVDAELTQSVFNAHVSGEIGMGVIPLLNDNSRVHFAAIDVDVYDAKAQADKNITHADIALALADSPLFVSRSKSGGIHIWVFSSEGVSAALAVDYLNSVATLIGVAGSEIFPKQTTRINDEDIGNWINLPYYGESRNAVLPNEEGALTSILEADLPTFLDLAEQIADGVTDEWLVDNTKIPATQRGNADSLPLWFDGPPCLQTLFAGHPERIEKINQKCARGDITDQQRDKQLAYARPQLDEGGRNKAFFNLGLYVRRRLFMDDPDENLDKDQRAELLVAVQDIHTDWLSLTGKAAAEGIGRELPTLAAQSSKGRWGYKCSEAPLKPHCNRRLCLKRQFGVGTSRRDKPIDVVNFNIITSSDPQYVFDIDGQRVYIEDTKTLLNQGLFAEAVTRCTRRVWPVIQPGKWTDMLTVWLENADEIEPAPDTDRQSILGNALLEFVTTKKIAKGQNDTSLHTGRVIWSDDELEATFKLDHFMNFIRAEKVVGETNAAVADALKTWFGVVARGNTHIGGKQVKPYVVNIATLKDGLGVNGTT